MELTQEEILWSVRNRKTYVTLTPYIRYNEWISKDSHIFTTKRIRANIFTTIEFTEEEIRSRIDTDAAVDYCLSAIAKREKEETPYYTTFLGEVGYIVDSRVRKEKGYHQNGLTSDDILNDINCITISYEGKDPIDIHRQTFIVNLDELAKRLTELGMTVDFGPGTLPAMEIKDTVLTDGLDATPEIAASKKHWLKPTKPKL